MLLNEENNCLSPNPNTLSPSLVFHSRKDQKKKEKKETCSEESNVPLKATLHNELYNAVWQHHVRPGLTVALSRRHLFFCVLMRHREGMLRVKISSRLETYCTALGWITTTAASLNPLSRMPLRDSNRMLQKG